MSEGLTKDSLLDINIVYTTGINFRSSKHTIYILVLLANTLQDLLAARGMLYAYNYQAAQ